MRFTVLLTTGVVMAALATGCGDDRSGPTTTSAVTTTTESTADVPEISGAPTPAATGCPPYVGPLLTGTIANPAVVESSGIAASHKNPDVYWTHNDSGDSPRVFATTLTGADLGTYSLSGATAHDYEDIATGPGPVKGTSYLYVGDIGAHNALNKRNGVTVYRVAEPAVSATQPPTLTNLDKIDRLDAVYPGGAGYDAESLFVDPLTADIYIATKSPNGFTRLFELPADSQATGRKAILEQVGAFQFPAPASATAADISPDGTRIVVRSPGRFWIWSRTPDMGISAAFSQPPCKYGLAEDAHGEGVAFDPTGQRLVFTREGAHPPIYLYGRAS